MEEAGTMSAVNFHAFDDANELTSKLSDKICKLLTNAIEKNGKASLVVSGGNTPKKLFTKLGLCDIAWDKVVISLCDERWIDNESDDSNEKLVRTYLLKNYAKKANFVGMFQQDTNLEDAKIIYEKIAKDKLSPIDVIILGMGDDGHTASLFPNNEKFTEAFSLKNRDFTLVVRQKDVKFHRLGLTRAAILNAKHIFLHFEGKKKFDIYNAAKDMDDFDKYPISSILNQKTKNIEVYYA